MPPSSSGPSKRFNGVLLIISWEIVFEKDYGSDFGVLFCTAYSDGQREIFDRYHYKDCKIRIFMQDNIPKAGE